jgi:hypothetical protein
MEKLEGTGLPHYLSGFGNDFRVGQIVGESLYAAGGEGDADGNFDD